MNKGNLTAAEIQKSHQAELEHLIEIKENWLNAYDRGQPFDLREAYENAFGFFNQASLEEWEMEIREKLKKKPSHIRSINFLASLGGALANEKILYTEEVYSERHYLLKKFSTEIRVRVFSSSEIFGIDIELPNQEHQVHYEFQTQIIHISKSGAAPKKTECSLQNFGLFEAIFDGIYLLNVDENLHLELQRIFHRFTDEMKISLEAFQPVMTSEGV